MQSSGIVSLEKSAFLRQRVEKSFSRFQKKPHKTQPFHRPQSLLELQSLQKFSVVSSCVVRCTEYLLVNQISLSATIQMGNSAWKQQKASQIKVSSHS